MSTLTKMAIAVFAGLLLGGGAIVGAQTGGTDRTVTETTTVEDRGDISGPCDEAEHANDPRCGGTGTIRDDDDNDREAGEDISGPCDEAEHANDPRCTGEGGARVDNSGPGSLNSGPGNARDRDDDGEREDNSGPGNADDRDDDDDDDHSGSGHGGDDSSGSGSSGSGSGGSDDD